MYTATMDVISEFLSVRYVLLLLISLLIGYTILYLIFRKPFKNLPPGPAEWGTSWKMLTASYNGTLPALATEWAKKYGQITYVNCLGQPVVFLNSTDVARKLYNSDEYKFLVADRFQIAATRILNFNGKDLIFSKFDAILRKKRRMFFSVMGLYGDGVAKFENVVWGEMERMFSDIDECEGKDIDLANIMARTLKLIIYVMAVGERPEDPTIPDVLEEYDLAFNKLSRIDLDFVLDYLPFLAKVPGKIKNYVDRLLDAKKKADEFMYFGPKRTHVPGKPRGMTDLLLELRKKPGNEWMDKDEVHIIAFISTLFFAAHLTTRASLAGSMLCLLNYPEVARKIQEEVDSVIGKERPKLEHKTSMPYTEAAIIEGLRLVSQVPLSTFRRPSETIIFEDMTIPKDSLIYMNNWHFLHDENVWEDPWTFKPERFLDKEGQLLPADHPKRKAVLVFGAGARVCPGEVFARSRIFLFTTSILQRYDLLPPATEKLTPADFQVYDESVLGIVRQAPAYRCRLSRRQPVQK